MLQLDVKTWDPGGDPLSVMVDDELCSLLSTVTASDADVADEIEDQEPSRTELDSHANMPVETTQS